MTAFPRYYKPSAIATLTSVAGTVFSVQDINLPPPAPRGPRIAFRVSKTLMSEPDEAEVAIYNLAPEREALAGTAFAELGRAQLLLFAGYEAATTRLFTGDVRTMRSHQKEGADYAWVCSADDAGDALAEITVSYSTSGWTVANMIQIAVAALAAGDPARGILPYPLVQGPSVAAAIAAAGPAAQGTLFSGVHAGKVTDLLDEAARICKARWWVADNILHFAQRRFPTDGLAFVLRSPGWLGEPSDDGNGVTRIPVLFDPNLSPGRQVTLVDQRLQQRFVKPVPYRIDAVTHTGDTRGGPWTSELTLRRFP